MLSGREVLVVGLDSEGLPEHPVLGGDVSRGSPAFERRGDEELDVVDDHAPVRLRVLSDQVGVDRHLCPAPSGDGRDEVERHDAALAPSEIHGVVVDG